MLASDLVSGPDPSRHFGRALRVNVLGGPTTVCSFHCAYCPSRLTALRPGAEWPSPAAVADRLERAIQVDSAIDTIVVGGNGEPTLHPAFADIIDRIVAVRAALVPDARTAIVSNGAMLGRIEVRRALSRADVRMMRLDAGDATTFRLVSGACVSLGWLIARLRQLGRVTLLTRFVRNADRSIDNTNAAAVDAWLEAIARIGPASVRICGPDVGAREPFDEIPRAELARIAARVGCLGIPATIV